MTTAALLAALVSPFVASASAVVFGTSGRVSGRVPTAVLGVAASAGLVVLVARGDTPSEDIGVLDLVIDRSSATLLALVLATGAVVAAFARRQLDAGPTADRHQALLGLVVGGAALVVVPGHPILLVAGWIVAGWALHGLLAHRCDWSPARRARRRLAITLAVGDLALVAAVVAAVAASDTSITAGAASSVAELLGSDIGGVDAAHVVALLLVVAGGSRSALWPFHRWLVGTLAAPTPVSALVHAGFVSAAGILLVRFAPIFVASDVAVVVAFVAGVATVVVGSLAGAVRADAKGVLAWSTVAQMAFMVVQCAVGAFSGAVFHMVGHGMYKAALFLGAGDTVSAALRSSRRPAAQPIARPAVVNVWALVVATAVVATGMALLPPDVNAAGVVLVAVFGWLSLAHATRGWLQRAPFGVAVSVGAAVAAAAVAVAGYLGGLRLVERWVAPSFEGLPDTTAISSWLLIDALVIVALLVGAVRWWPGTWGARIRRAVHRFARDTSVCVGRPATVAGSRRAGDVPEHRAAIQSAMMQVPVLDDARRGAVRAGVARAASIIAPQWPLASFVAVNPLGGLEHEGFDEASAAGRRWLHGRTHLSLDEHRRDHTAGLVDGQDLDSAILVRFMELCSEPAIVVAGRKVPVSEVIRLDLLHGAEVEAPSPPRTALERIEGATGVWGEVIDEIVDALLRDHVGHPAWSPVPAGAGLVATWRSDPVADRRLRRSLAPAAVAWLEALPADPASIVAVALEATGIDPADQVDEMRGHLARVHGWAGLAKWRNEWAPDADPHVALTLVEIVAVRAAFEAAVLASGIAERAARVSEPADWAADPRACERTDAVLLALGTNRSNDAEAAERITAVLAHVEPSARRSTWLEAAERHFDQHLLGLLDRLDPGRELRPPEAQVVFCIDVRSEGLRRRLEDVGPYETLGFAGFFGVAMRISALGSPRPEARCPVLVKPSVDAVEHPLAGSEALAARRLATRRTRGGAAGAHAGSKYGPGGPFVMAESLGWALGPVAAVRTFLAGRRPFERSGPDGTVVELRVDDIDGPALAPDQRLFVAEAVLNTMGLTSRFAPLVVLCGHTSHTVNNPHATALECGACAGASGDGNARAVANLLNEPAIRAGLVERGIEIPDSTRFVPAIHDTVTDRVELLETVLVPTEWQDRLVRLAGHLEAAGRRQSAVRAEHLPGASSAVRRRGDDWAQVRPEWGLARNAAFVIGPRSITADIELDGRAFLHTYDAAADPSGRVLETIMTAPLVVAHWISSQYYFSTVDPEVFGAGDKLLHNPIGDVGVLSGPSGDLRVGLPLQSTHLGDRRHHQPIRLLAVVQAPLERIEQVIRVNPVLQTLFGGSWMRLAGRSHPHEPWSTRTADGTWITTPRRHDTPTTAGDESEFENV